MFCNKSQIVQTSKIIADNIFLVSVLCFYFVLNHKLITCYKIILNVLQIEICQISIDFKFLYEFCGSLFLHCNVIQNSLVIHTPVSIINVLRKS